MKQHIKKIAGFLIFFSSVFAANYVFAVDPFSEPWINRSVFTCIAFIGGNGFALIID